MKYLIIKPSDHSHKKREDSLEALAEFSWILILTWNFGSGRRVSASTIFQMDSKRKLILMLLEV